MRFYVRPALIAWMLLVVPTVQAQSGASESEADPYFAPDRILAFAEYLSQQGDLSRAVSEYQRYLFSSAPERHAYAHYRLGQSFLQLGETQPAARNFLQAARTAERPLFRDSSHVAYVGALLAGGHDAELFEAVDTLSVRPGGGQGRLHRLTALAHLRRGEWDQAQRALAQVPGAGPTGAPGGEAISVTPLAHLIEEGRNLPQKSPVAAGLLSAIVPGSGKVYAGRLVDGLYSLLLVGGSAWLAYDGFSEDGASSVKGWIFGTAGAVLYVGNVYGSVVAVRLYNASQMNEFQHDVQAQISISTRF